VDEARPAGTRPIVIRHCPIDHDQRTRLVVLLASGLERYLRTRAGVSDSPLTTSPDVCLYTAHGHDDEAPGE
jgi:hypothetical protein